MENAPEAQMVVIKEALKAGVVVGVGMRYDGGVELPHAAAKMEAPVEETIEVVGDPRVYDDLPVVRGDDEAAVTLTQSPQSRC